MEKKRIVRSAADSLARLRGDRGSVASSVGAAHVSRRLKSLAKPSSRSSALKKAGVALIIATPDPITALPGAALIAASYATRGKEPAKLEDLATETRRILRDIQGLSL